MVESIIWAAAAAVVEPALGMAYAPNDGFHHWRWEIGLGILILPVAVLAVLWGFRCAMAWVLRRARIGPLS